MGMYGQLSVSFELRGTNSSLRPFSMVLGGYARKVHSGSQECANIYEDDNFVFLSKVDSHSETERHGLAAKITTKEGENKS